MAKLILVILLCGLAACSSGPGIQPAPEPAPGQPAPATSGTPAAPPAPVRESVQAYVDSARAAFARGDLRQTIALSERGLRINRYTGELYLMLAQAYAALDNPAQSANFARLGLRYAGSGSDLAQALQAFIPQ